MEPITGLKQKQYFKYIFHTLPYFNSIFIFPLIFDVFGGTVMF